jgi:hypothetical protein
LYSRPSRPGEPAQGWKLHVSATVVDACDLFERVAPVCARRDLRFKAPKTLRDLIDLNSGVRYGYSQVGKFITIYPSNESEALELARELHEVTHEFVSVQVPFDRHYSEGSNVFYRYGTFETIEINTGDGSSVSGIRNASGELVPDDCTRPVPEWVLDPFDELNGSVDELPDDSVSPLATTYRVFRAVSQRGKGGTYHALDVSGDLPRFCIVKEGRRNGELGWNGQDGYELVRNEETVLRALEKCDDAPTIYSSFQVEGNFYLVMEYVDGKSLFDLMKVRRRRFSIKQIIDYSIGIAEVLERIGNAGWVWNDCKPANIIVTKNGALRPIDFENSYRIGSIPSFNWRSNNYSRRNAVGPAADLYSLGAAMYFMLTGVFYDPGAPTPIEKLRRNVTRPLSALTRGLLEDSERAEAKEVRNQLQTLAKGSRIFLD